MGRERLGRIWSYLYVLAPSLEGRVLAVEAAGEAGGHAGEAAEVAVEVALVGKADGESEVGERKLGIAKHLLDMFQAAPEQVTVRRDAERLLKSAGKMVRREACHRGQGVETDLFADVRLDEIADTVLHGRGKAAALCVGSFGHGHEAEHAETRLGVNDGFGPIAGE